jgi:hypothetical protein
MNEKKTIYVINDGTYWLVEAPDGICHGVCDTLQEAIECAKGAVEMGYGDTYCVDE